MAEKSKPIRNIESAERNKLGYSRTRITVKTKSGNNIERWYFLLQKTYIGTVLKKCVSPYFSYLCIWKY